MFHFSVKGACALVSFLRMTLARVKMFQLSHKFYKNFSLSYLGCDLILQQLDRPNFCCYHVTGLSFHQQSKKQEIFFLIVILILSSFSSTVL